MRASCVCASLAAVRVRYAPSPTGFLHLGGLRTALYNALFARAAGGTFIVRIEDTDRRRQVAGSAESLLRALRWCGLPHDEGPELDASGATLTGCLGAAGPYIQSQRLPSYVAVAEELLSRGHAYRCFCSAERLTALREAAARSGMAAPSYDRRCAHVPAGESARRAAAGEPHVVRLFVPAGETSVDDGVLGRVSFSHTVVDDQVLLKSDGFPTYHLAAVVDDHAMAVSHVIRGQEWLSSTPKHLLLHAAMGWAPPIYAHLPLLLNTDRSKLSKRAGDAAVEDFVAAGYTPAGLLNFVALLGWTPPAAAEQGEVMSLEDMVRAPFRLADINKSNAVVDRARLDFFNREHIKRQLGVGTAVRGGAAAPVAGAQPAAELHVDTFERAAVRASVYELLEAPLRGLHDAAAAAAAVDGAGSLPAYLPAVARGRDAALAALLLAHADRINTYADYVPLLLPFLASDAEFCALLSRQLRGGGAAEGGDGLSGNPLPHLDVRAAAMRVLRRGSGGIGPGSTAEESLRAWLVGVGPALRDAVSAWEGMADAAFVGEAPVDAVKRAAKAHRVPPGQAMLALRVALTGLDVGAAFSDTLQILGRASCIARARALLAVAA